MVIKRTSNLDKRLQTLSLQGARILDGNTTLQRLQEERDSIKQCLAICAQASEHVDQLQSSGLEDVSTAQDIQVRVSLAGGLISAKRMTVDVLRECRDNLARTTCNLEAYLQKMDNRLQTLSSQGARISGEDAAEREQVQEERNRTKNCLAICAQASEWVHKAQTNVFEDVSSAQNTNQMMVATPCFGEGGYCWSWSDTMARADV